LWRASPFAPISWVCGSFSLDLWLTNNRRVGHQTNRCTPSAIGVDNRPSFRTTINSDVPTRGEDHLTGARHRVGRRCPSVCVASPSALVLGCTLHKLPVPTPKEIRNKSSGCAFPLSGIGRISGDAQVLPLFAPRSNVTGGAHGRRYRLFDDNCVFPVLVTAGAAASGRFCF